MTVAQLVGRLAVGRRAARPRATGGRSRDCRDSCVVSRAIELDVGAARHRTSCARRRSAQHGPGRGLRHAVQHRDRPPECSRSTGLAALWRSTTTPTGMRSAAAAAHVTASRCRTGRPVTRFCGFRRSTLSASSRGSDRPARRAPSRSRSPGSRKVRRNSPTTRAARRLVELLAVPQRIADPACRRRRARHTR